MIGKPWNLTRDTIIKVIPILGPEYKIEIEIRIRDFSGSWPNIFRFSAIDGNCCKIGQRIPALFIRTEGILYLATNIGNNGDRVFHDVLGKFEADKWYKLTILQKKDKVLDFMYSI